MDNHNADTIDTTENLKNFKATLGDLEKTLEIYESMTPDELQQFSEQLLSLEAETLDTINNAIIETAKTQEKKVEQTKNPIRLYSSANTIDQIDQKFNKKKIYKEKRLASAIYDSQEFDAKNLQVQQYLEDSLHVNIKLREIAKSVYTSEEK